MGVLRSAEIEPGMFLQTVLFVRAWLLGLLDFPQCHPPPPQACSGLETLYLGSVPVTSEMQMPPRAFTHLPDPMLHLAVPRVLASDSMEALWPEELKKAGRSPRT